MSNPTVNQDILTKSILKGVLAFLILMSVYFLTLNFISGLAYTLGQFYQFWYYIIPLALGFGTQITLYSYLKTVAKQASKGQLVATGTTSTAAMISCCAHYLTNILPILGVAGIITFISQYQIQFFWVGLAFNLLGIIYIGNKVLKITGLKINKSLVFYGVLLVVIFIFFFLNSILINISPKTTSSANSSQLQTQENNEASVLVSVTPQNLNKVSDSWNFDLTLTTHSGSIDTDLAASSELIDDKGNSYKPVSWEGSPPGGHHRNGVLKFNAITPKPKFIELKIYDVGEVSVRSFKWNL